MTDQQLLDWMAKVSAWRKETDQLRDRYTTIESSRWLAEAYGGRSLGHELGDADGE